MKYIVFHRQGFAVIWSLFQGDDIVNYCETFQNVVDALNAHPNAQVL